MKKKKKQKHRRKQKTVELMRHNINILSTHDSSLFHSPIGISANNITIIWKLINPQLYIYYCHSSIDFYINKLIKIRNNGIMDSWSICTMTNIIVYNI